MLGLAEPIRVWYVFIMTTTHPPTDHDEIMEGLSALDAKLDIILAALSPPSQPDHLGAGLGLRDRLREWRKKEAISQGWPAYIIFKNETLDALVLEHPTTQAGVTKLMPKSKAKYAADVLRIIKDYDFEQALEAHSQTAEPDQRLTGLQLSTLLHAPDLYTDEAICAEDGFPVWVAAVVRKHV